MFILISDEVANIVLSGDEFFNNFTIRLEVVPRTILSSTNNTLLLLIMLFIGFNFSITFLSLNFCDDIMNVLPTYLSLISPSLYFMSLTSATVPRRPVTDCGPVGVL